MCVSIFIHIFPENILLWTIIDSEMTLEVQTILHLLSGSALCCKGKDGHGHGDHVVSVTHPDGTVTSAIVMGGGG